MELNCVSFLPIDQFNVYLKVQLTHEINVYFMCSSFIH